MNSTPLFCANRFWHAWVQIIPFQSCIEISSCVWYQMKEGKMSLIMKNIVWLNLVWQWRYPTDKTGFSFIGTHCIVDVHVSLFLEKCTMVLINSIHAQVFYATFTLFNIHVHMYLHAFDASSISPSETHRQSCPLLMCLNIIICVDKCMNYC